MKRPRIALTMGDGTGVGPELIVKALSRTAVSESGRLVVLGDPVRLATAAAICGVDTNINVISRPDAGLYQPGTIDVIASDPLPADLPFGTLSARAGEAAYGEVVDAVRLALDHDVDALCTGPISKNALQLAGHDYPGQTELLSALTGVSEVSIMLTAPKLRVVQTTGFIGLLDAINRLNPDLVFRTIVRAHSALASTGMTHPRLAVCAVNPHAGEGGRFGEMEEELKIAPGVRQAQSLGIDALGPMPADLAFLKAVRGDCDVVVAMYHDQGYGPIRVLGDESRASLTLGLPFVRASIEEGPDELAGTGRVDEAGIVEGLRQITWLANDSLSSR